jgi:S-layer family protein
MRNSVRLTLMLVAVSCLASAGRAADRPEGTLVTDQAVLASMGFTPDAIVYIAPEGALPTPQNYGNADPIQQEASGVDFRGRVSTYAYGTGTGGGDVAFTGGDIFADALLQLPSGSIWENTRLWVNDTNAAADMAFFLFRSCLPAAGPGAPVNTNMATATSTGATGDQSFVIALPAGTVIDNNACFYWVRVRFDAAGLILRKARSQYRLQVSPAPATATFNDVPATSGQFRFVEALVKAGITAGCGGGNFCPNDPITRGQMAVFLSTALGLQWP